MNKLFCISIAFLFIIELSFAEEPAEIHCKHFFYGYPLGTPKTNDLIIRDIYSLSNNDSTKFADWVAYRLDKKIIQGGTKKRNWKADPWLDENETLEPSDYNGANEALSVDRGHQAPLADFKGSDVWYESNYLSNITPQKSKLNQGKWKDLEEKERNLLDSFDIIYVITGPLYELDMGKLPQADEYHKIPSGYWKIIIVPDVGKKKEIKTASFIFSQNEDNDMELKKFAVSIDEIEKRTGLDFLWEMNDIPEEKIEKEINKNWLERFF